MNNWIGWALALAAVVAGWFSYGWQGIVLAVSLVAFWLLLQFSRVMRLLQKAGSAPKGSVASAVMVHSKLRDGMRLMDVIALTRSLGIRLSETPEVWRWEDDGGVGVELEFSGGRCVRRTLTRPEAGDETAAA
ncbi:MAG: hypothetical protein IV092_17305 [Burkholderiaceae bacterium]|nr:hypothetical protein [Burkholderiaceae bacterium]